MREKNIKKMKVIAVCFCMTAAGLTGCGGSSSEDTTESQTTTVESVADEKESTSVVEEIETTSEELSVTETTDTTTEATTEAKEELRVEITRHEFWAEDNDTGVSCMFVNELPQITSGVPEDIKNKINQDLQENYNQKDTEKQQLSEDAEWQETSNTTESAEYYYETYEAELSYQDDSLLCIRFDSGWWAGGVSNYWTTGLTYDLTSGDALGIRDFIEGTDEEIKQKIVDAYNAQYGTSDVTVDNAFAYTELDDLGFYIDADSLYVSFGAYGPIGGNGEQLIVFER